MRRILRLAVRARREPLPYARAVSALVTRYIGSRGVGFAGRWLDVGAGGGALGEALRAAGAARVTAVDVTDRRLSELHLPAFVIGSGAALPFGDRTFDGVASSNVLEHVADGARLIDEMVRVCRPGGVIYLSWTNWYSPLGGHEWSPFHYLGERWGPRAYALVRRRPPAWNVPGRTLFPVHVGEVLRLVRKRRVRIVDVAPRYWPSARWIGRIPGLREVAMWNCVILMQVRS